MAKTTKTYSINEKTYDLFDRICKKKNINKSSFIENTIKDYLSENLGYDDELYQSKMDDDIIVSIIGTDGTFFELSDGSRISKIMFYHNFKGFETIDPKGFFGQSPAFKIVEQVKQMGDGEFENIEIGIPSVDERKIETNAFFNKGTDGIEKSDKVIIKMDDKIINEFINKMGDIIGEYKRYESTPNSDENLILSLRILSRTLKKEFIKSKYLKSKFKNTKLKINKGIKLLIDIDNDLMNEEILDAVNKLKDD